MRYCYYKYRKLILRLKSKEKRNTYFNFSDPEVVPELKLEQFIDISAKIYILNLQFPFFVTIIFQSGVGPGRYNVNNDRGDKKFNGSQSAFNSNTKRWDSNRDKYLM